MQEEVHWADIALPVGNYILTPCINRLFLAVVIPIAAAVALPKISKIGISAANPSAIHVFSSIANNESTPYECSDLFVSVPSLDVERLCDDLLIRACRTMEPALEREPALANRPL